MKEKLIKIGNVEIPYFIRVLLFVFFMGLLLLWFSGYFGF